MPRRPDLYADAREVAVRFPSVFLPRQRTTEPADTAQRRRDLRGDLASEPTLDRHYLD